MRVVKVVATGAIGLGLATYAVTRNPWLSLVAIAGVAGGAAAIWIAMKVGGN